MSDLQTTANLAEDESLKPSDKITSVSSRGAMAVFLAVWLASGWFWQSRDWNVASRLMLVYALGDRGSLSIDGLQRQTGDLAFKDGHYYCDKAPGFSFLAVPSYILGKSLFGFQAHPLNQDGFAYWPADAWVTWCTSGMASGLIAAAIFLILARSGVNQSWAMCCGVLSVWASPMAVYATLAYGHQVASGLFLAATLMIFFKFENNKPLWPLLAGLSCGLGVLTELAQAPLAIVIGLVGAFSGPGLQACAKRALLLFLGALPTALLLMAYNFIAFGSAFDMGYFHHATQQFAKVHSADNPLGLGSPDFSRLLPLLWGQYRGLLFYAPWAVCAPIGWLAMLRQRQFRLLAITLSGFMVPLWVNLSYPEWTGGWSTGPRLLVPALPWLGLASGFALRYKPIRTIALPLYLMGLIIADLFLSVGGRVSQDYAKPIQDVLQPIWLNSSRPAFWPGELLARVHLSGLLDFNSIDPRWWTGFYFVFQLILVFVIFQLNSKKTSRLH